jgi:hypothetical protein
VEACTMLREFANIFNNSCNCCMLMGL